MPQAPVRSGLRLGHFFAIGLVLVIGAALYFFIFRNFYNDHPLDRARGGEHHDWLASGFSIAVVWPPHEDKSLVEGIKQGLYELENGLGPFKDAGRLKGKINLLPVYVEKSDKGAVAREIVTHDDVLAVFGHELVGTSIPASVTYEKHGVLFFSPKNTDQRLTRHGFNYVFRLTPDDESVAAALAKFALDNKWKRVGLLYARVLRHRLVADQFITAMRRLMAEEAAKAPVDELVDHSQVKFPPFEKSFFHEPEVIDNRYPKEFLRQDFRPTIESIVRIQDSFDAIMLADDYPWATKLLLDMKSMGLNKPILATDKLDTSRVRVVAGDASDNLYVASAVNPQSPNQAYVDFQNRFRANNGGENAGYGASQGYEAFLMFVTAILKSGTADPLVVASRLKTEKAWPGLFGDIWFDDNGDIRNRPVSIKKMTPSGQFQTVAEERVDIRKER
jgi:branched-chain amino acid transport system substrate-binding protein